MPVYVIQRGEMVCKHKDNDRQVFEIGSGKLWSIRWHRDKSRCLEVDQGHVANGTRIRLGRPGLRKSYPPGSSRAACPRERGRTRHQGGLGRHGTSRRAFFLPFRGFGVARHCDEKAINQLFFSTEPSQAPEFSGSRAKVGRTKTGWLTRSWACDRPARTFVSLLPILF